MNLTSRIILNWNTWSWCLISWFICQQIPYLLIVNFKIRYFNNEIMLIMASDFLKNLIDWSRNDASVFKIRSSSIHSEGLSSSSLPITHYSAIIPICYILNNFLSTKAEYIFLGWIVHNFIKLEFPWLLLIINESSMGIFRYVHSNMLWLHI